MTFQNGIKNYERVRLSLNYSEQQRKYNLHNGVLLVHVH